MDKKKRIRLKVASPCQANWDAMSGDEAIRFCGLCEKNVYQISNMTNEQVEELLAESGEKKCGRFYQRADGTLVTADCSVGLRRKRRKQAIVGVGAGLVSAIGIAIGSGGGATPPSQVPSNGNTVVETPWDQDLIMGEMEVMPDELIEEALPKEVIEAVDMPEEPPRIIMGRMRRMPDHEIDE
jgi:hypothetical protein